MSSGYFLSPLAPGIRIFDDEGMSTDVTESKALIHEIESVDIYSNSWGPGDMGLEIEGPGRLTSEAIRHGIEKVWYEVVFTVYGCTCIQCMNS